MEHFHEFVVSLSKWSFLSMHREKADANTLLTVTRNKGTILSPDGLDD